MPPNRPSSILLSHFIWQFHLLRYFLSQDKVALIVTTGLRVFSQFAQLFSLFIPLKIILILSNNALPSFAQDSMKFLSIDAWVAILTFATVILYVLSIMSDLTANHIVGQAGKKLTQSTNILDGNQKRTVEILTTAYNSYANYVVIVFGITGMLILNPIIFLCILLVIIGQLVITDLISGCENGAIGWVKRRVEAKPAEYINYLSAADFILVFISLLIGYRITGSIDTLIAILTLLLARKMFQSITQLARQLVKLRKRSFEKLFSTVVGN
jgi:hypothetical protein